MNPETAIALYRSLRTTRHVELRRDLESAAVAYAHRRAQWALALAEDRREMDAARTAEHNVLIGSCDALARSMAHSGEDPSWRTDLGSDRRAIGDFACHLHAHIALSAR